MMDDYRIMGNSISFVPRIYSTYSKSLTIFKLSWEKIQILDFH